MQNVIEGQVECAKKECTSGSLIRAFYGNFEEGLDLYLLITEKRQILMASLRGRNIPVSRKIADDADRLYLAFKAFGDATKSIMQSIEKSEFDPKIMEILRASFVMFMESVKQNTITLKWNWSLI